MTNGQQATLKDVLEKHLEDMIDTKRKAAFYPNEDGSAFAFLDHDVILLALSAEIFPVTIERMAGKMRNNPL